MLPSTGRFKDIRCPFFTNGLCERPYCHFRHPRKRSSEYRSPLKADSSFISECVKQKETFQQHLTSEADKKSTKRTDLQGTFARLSRSPNEENVPGECTAKETHSSSNAFTSRQSRNVPAPQHASVHKTTHIPDHKNRHIPVGSLSSAIKNKTVLKRKSNNIESFSQTKWKKDYQNDCEEFITFSSLLKNDCKRNVLSIHQESSLNTSLEITKRWGENEFKNTSSTEKIKQNSYASFATITHNSSPAEYKHSEETVLAINERLAVTGSDAEFNACRVSPFKTSEPEYQSFCSYKSIHEYTTKREDFAKANSDITANFLNDSPDKKLNCSNFRNADEKEDVSDDQMKHLECGKNISFTVARTKKFIKNEQSEYGKNILGSNRKESKSRKDNESDRQGEKQKESNKRCNNKIQNDNSNIWKDFEECVASKDYQKKNENERNSGYNENNRRKRDDSLKERKYDKDSENGDSMKNHSSRSHSHYKQSSKKSSGQNNHEKNCNRHSKKNDVHSNIIFHKQRVKESSGHCPSLSEQEVTSTSFPDTLPTGMWVCSNEDKRSKQYHTLLLQDSETNFTENLTQPSHNLLKAEEETFVSGRYRIAHEGAQSRKLVMPPGRHSSVPSQTLSESIQKVRESRDSGQTLSQGQAQNQAEACVHSHSTSDNPPSMNQKYVICSAPQSMGAPLLSAVGKRRIAHVPYVARMLAAKRELQEKLKQSSSEPAEVQSASTKVQTLPKGVQRTAHVPLNTVLTRPVMRGVGDKIPFNIRQRYLNILVNEYLQVSSSTKEACDRAADEEKSIYNRSTSRNLYTSYVSNTIMSLRKASEINKTLKLEKIMQCKNNGNETVHSFSPNEGVDTNGLWNIKKRNLPVSVVSRSLYESLSQFVLTEEQLKQNGFPLSHGKEEGIAVIHNFYHTPFIPKTPSERMCIRCSKIYYVNKKGLAIEEELCVYHWGRPFQRKRRGCWEYTYNCCQSQRDAIGCSVGNCHVSDNYDPNNLPGFVKTLPKETSLFGDYSVYALDCEMCYTTVGLELSRVSVIDTNRKIVYESLVKPESTIIDYNTRFSGIREHDLENVSTNIYEVQSILLSLIHDKTIIVGHSLENDFKALKLIHGKVVDTSVVYPHKMGLPKKRALKSLCRENLQKIIQENSGGHDSAEDACAAMELMLFKVKEEAKTR